MAYRAYKRSLHNKRKIKTVTLVASLGLFSLFHGEMKGDLNDFKD